ncbi:SBBP repeat-containing protein [candidate division KSB1 bacterium]
MKYSVAFINLLLIAATSFLKAGELQKNQILENYGKIPLVFTSNSGQFDSQVEFVSAGNGIRIFHTREGTTFLLSRETEESIAKRTKPGLEKRNQGVKEYEPFNLLKEGMLDIGMEYYALKLKFINSNPEPMITGEEKVPWNSNYFIGSDQNSWQTDVQNYSKIKFGSLYNGIDLTCTGDKSMIKYEFVIQPGADHRQIQLSYDIGDKIGKGLLKMSMESELAVKTPFGVLIKRKPYCYQIIKGESIEIEADYKINNEELNKFSINVSTYNPDFPLIIGFKIMRPANISAIGRDCPAGILYDVQGNAYICGNVESSDFPTTPGAFDKSYNGGFSDAFVCKLSPSGNNLIYSTYIGGNNLESIKGFSLDSSGNVYITGFTRSRYFPTTPGTYNQNHRGGDDVFVCKLNSSGNALIYSTLIGGRSYEEGDGISIDNDGNAYIAGHACSEDFPTTPGAFNSNCDGDTYDIFVLKVNPTGSDLIYSTLIVGIEHERGNRIAVDSKGDAYITGSTGSSDFPTTAGAFDNIYSGEDDGFVCKLNSTGSALIYSTFLGGSDSDGSSEISLDSNGNAFITGSTRSSDFPTTTGAFDNSYNGEDDGFVCKLNSSGNALIYSTFLGGSGSDGCGGIIVDGSGDAYITGSTGSSDFPITSGAYDETYNGGTFDGFVCKLNSSGNALIYSTFLGGSSLDVCSKMIIDSDGNAYIAGYTESIDFPTTIGAYDESYNEERDVFVCKLNSSGNALIYSTYIGGGGITPEIPPEASDFKIISIQDVPYDEGKQVSISWSQYPTDVTGASGTVITKYSIWRKKDYNPSLFQKAAIPPGDWEFVKEVPAVQSSVYHTIVPTVADVTIYYDYYYSTFFVCAHTSDPAIHWETEPSSGYSIDNSVENYFIQQNYPNPFNTKTSINYKTPRTALVSIKIFNTLGQEVRTLISELQPVGYHKILWNGTNNEGMKLPSGIYIYKFQADNFVHVKKMVFLK